MESIKVFITDDHQVVREGMTALLEENDLFVFLGDGKNGKDTLNKIAVMEVKPDVILMDVNMPVMDGIDCTAEIVSKYNGKIRVVALTMVNQALHIRKMMQAGASGYLLKNCDKSELYKAIQTVYEGESYFSAEVGQIVMNEMVKINKPANPYDPTSLTKREIEILQMIAKDLSNQAIADKLHISIRTVESHKQNLLIKTGANSAAGLVIYGIRHKLIDPG